VDRNPDFTDLDDAAQSGAARKWMKSSASVATKEQLRQKDRLEHDMFG
jgi:hypothetical protein